MHYDLIIISDQKYNFDLLNKFNYHIIDESHYLIDLYQTNNNITFNNLIVRNLTSINNIDVLVDDDKVITNYFFQTNYDHIFAIGQIINSSKQEFDQLCEVLEFLND